MECFNELPCDLFVRVDQQNYRLEKRNYYAAPNSTITLASSVADKCLQYIKLTKESPANISFHNIKLSLFMRRNFSRSLIYSLRHLFFFFNKLTKLCTAGKTLTLYFCLCFLIKVYNSLKSPAQEVVFALPQL